MIKWLSGSRLKTGTENESPSSYTNDPLAAITELDVPKGKSHIYAVSRLNPLFREEAEREETEGCLKIEADQRLSPRKSISSGYESRCNSSSDSSSCTECEEKLFKKTINSVKREKRLTKQSKNEKKRIGEHEVWNFSSNKKRKETSLSDSTNLKRRARRLRNGCPASPSNLSPIPEGRIDCSIPPPIWPRFRENSVDKNECSRIDFKIPGRIYHDGTTNPVNFMYKYNERYPKCPSEKTRPFWNYSSDRLLLSSDGISVKSEYERNWVECCDSQCWPYDSFRELELTHEVLRDLATLIAYALDKKSTLTVDVILRNLADSLRQNVEFLSRTENEHGIRFLCNSINRKKYLSKMLAALMSRNCCHQIHPPLTGDGNRINGIDTAELALQLQKLSKKSRNVDDELTGYRYDDNSKDEIYSSGSEGKTSTSSSSGCKDLYMSSNSSSSAGKENIFTPVSFESAHKNNVENSSDEKEGKETGEKGGNAVFNIIHHQRDFSSSSAESAFGSSDISPPSSDSSSAQGVLNPVFLHENIYSMPKSMQNAIICESFNRTENADCGSLRNCGSSAYEKLISAKRKTSCDSQPEETGPLAYVDEEKPFHSAVITSAKVDTTILSKVEHPYYVAMGRPDFTLDLPQAERLMKKIASSKRRRCWCRFTTSVLGLAFFLLSVMMVSLVITKGRRMFGAL